MHDLALNHKGQKSLAWKENFENNNYAKGTVIFDIECIILLSVCMLCMHSTMMPVTYMGMRRVFQCIPAYDIDYTLNILDAFLFNMRQIIHNYRYLKSLK